MTTRLQEIVSDLLKSSADLSSYIFILPSKRAGYFLKREIVAQLDKTAFSPKVVSIEEFIEEIADLKIADPISLLFEFYETYLSISSITEKETFEHFSSWANTLLNDFNEIDRNLVPHRPFFSYLEGIKETEHWYLSSERTELIENYLSFWNSLLELYEEFTDRLQKKGRSHQGLVYRQAAQNMEHYIKSNRDNKHIFIGFNALNKAEELIIQELLETGNTEIYWDADSHFMEKDGHSASHFLRQHKENWKYFKTQPFKNISENYVKPKEITIAGISKNIGQAKYVGELLSGLSTEELQQTAVVLADENLLLPVIHSLPSNVKEINITMGVPLKSLPAISFFENLLQLHLKTSDSFYYKDILQVSEHFIGKILLPESGDKISKELKKTNSTYLSLTGLIDLTEVNERHTLKLLFAPKKDVTQLISDLHSCIFLLKKKEEVAANKILLETLFKTFEVLNKIIALNKKYPHIQSADTLFAIFKELTAITNLDFKGEPYKGLQLMGVLETRVLDFKNVILVSVNEGIFPSGKTSNSFLTYDLKNQFDLPTHKEKDAVYSYHFYRLLHRAQEVYLLYNNLSSGLNVGEKSRFIRQMEFENLKNHKISKISVLPESTNPGKLKKEIAKTPEVLEKIKQLATKGFSPSALTAYIRNPVDFYYRYILGVQEVEELEETVAANTLGTIIHDTLQTHYEPLENKFLTIEDIEAMRKNTADEVARQFAKTYKKGDISTGKNLIIFEIARNYVDRFLKQEIKGLKKNNRIKILKIEKNLEATFDTPELNFPVKIRGKVDRIDEVDGTIRVIDYKTGKVQQSELIISEWELLTADYKFSKAFQVLAYALMAKNEIPEADNEAGIICFKNLNAGFMKFSSKGKETLITKEILESFTVELKNLILEICNPDIPFTEKEIK